MSAPPPEGYGQYPAPAQQYGQPSPYPDQPQGYEDSQPSPPPQATSQHAADAGRKKKRAYAAGAFDVGAGGNAAAGGQLQGAGQFGAPQPVAPGYAGYPQQDPQAAAYGAPSPGYGMQQPGAPVGGPVGYQAPEPYYPSAGAPPVAAPGPGAVAGLTSGLSAMQLGAGAQGVQPAPVAARPVALNQLYPTDLINQPFNVSELDLPPPPIILPPNVSLLRPSSPRLTVQHLINLSYSRVSRPLQMRTARPNTFAPPSMLFLPHTPCSRSPNYLLPWSSSHMALFTTWTIQCPLSRIKSSLGAGDVGLISTLTSPSWIKDTGGVATCATSPMTSPKLSTGMPQLRRAWTGGSVTS